jgi:Na+-driven multidrug efflux pump
LNSTRKVTNAQVFAIAGPAMVANLTTPLIGIVSTTAIGRLGDATLLGGVAIASVIFNLWFVVASPLLAVFAFTYDGIFIGATWAREMRNLMLLSLAIFLATWFALRTFGNAGLWTAMLALLCRARRLAGAALSRQSARFIPASQRQLTRAKGATDEIALCRQRRCVRLRRQVQHLLSGASISSSIAAHRRCRPSEARASSATISTSS